MANTYTVNGQPVSEQQFKAHWNGVLGADPVIRNLRAMLEQQKPAIGSPQRKAFEAAVDKRLAELGFGNSNSPTGTADHDMRAHFKDGKLVVDRGSYLDRNKDWIAALGAGAAILGPFAAAWLAAPAVSGAGGGGAAGAGGAAAIPATASYSAPAAVSGGSVASSTAAAGAPGAISTAGPTAGSWAAKLFGDGVGSDLVKAGIGSGLGYLQRRSERNADRESIDAALAAQKEATAEANARLDRQGRLRGEIYNTQRGDFNNLAMPGFSTLSELLGLGRPQPIGPVNFQNAPPTNPTAVMSGVPRGTVPPPGTDGSNFNPRVGQQGVGMRSLADFSGGGGMVPMVSPTGERDDVPADQVAHYESLGARRL